MPPGHAAVVVGKGVVQKEIARHRRQRRNNLGGQKSEPGRQGDTKTDKLNSNPHPADKKKAEELRRHFFPAQLRHHEREELDRVARIKLARTMQPGKKRVWKLDNFEFAAPARDKDVKKDLETLVG